MISQPRSTTWPTRLLAIVGWLVAAGLLLVALLRLVHHDGWVLFTWFNAFTAYLYLPAYAVLAWALWHRRGLLAAASAAAIAFHLAWVLPDFQPASARLPDAPLATDAPTVRIYFANIHGGENFRMDDIIAEARRWQADVILFAEMQRWWWHTMIARQPLAKDYPFGTDRDHRNSGDIGLFSRLPILRLEQFTIETRTSLVFDVLVGDRPLRVIALHSPRPKFHMLDNYYKYWEQLEPIIAEQRDPLLVIGDFNATQHSRVYQQLLRDGLRSAHVDRGRGYATTWPNGEVAVPPIRIDQAMISPQIECLSIEEATAPGSDHKALLLEVRLAAPAAGASGQSN